jgi:multiple sugar transport system ATP-binding protein
MSASPRRAKKLVGQSVESNNTMASVTLKNVSKTFGAINVVDDVCIDVADGEFLVLLGPSGCGKSTTLRMIAGLEAASSGSISIGARDVTDLEPADRNIAMVFQNYALYPHKTVYENLAFGLRMRGVGKADIDARVRRAAGVLGIEPLLARRPRQLSGGQMQRVALGRALVREPEVFLLDEPLSNLDAKMRVQMREEIGRLHGETEISMVYVTHDQVEAMTLGDRVCIMRDGRVQQIARPIDVYDQPANRFVAGFVGSPEMNIIEGELDGDGTFRNSGLRFPIPPGQFQQAKPGRPVSFGIRPEHLALGAPGDSACGRITMIERLGAQMQVAIASGGIRLSSLIARNEALQVGDAVGLTADSQRLHLFDAENGISLRKT